MPKIAGARNSRQTPDKVTPKAGRRDQALKPLLLLKPWRAHRFLQLSPKLPTLSNCR